MESALLTLPLFLPQGQELFRAEPAGVAELRHVLDKVGAARASGWIRIAMPGYTGTLLLLRGTPVAAVLEQDGRPEPQYGAEAYDATVALLRLGAGLVLVRLDERTARAAAGLVGPPSHSRWLSAPVEEAKLALEILGGARFSGAVELLPRENPPTSRAVILMHAGRVLGIYDTEAPVPQPSLDGLLATILAQATCCLRLFPAPGETVEPLPAPAELAGAASSWTSAATQPTAATLSTGEPGRTPSRPARPDTRPTSGGAGAGPVLRRAVSAPQGELPGRAAAAPPRTPPGVPLRRSRLSAPGSPHPRDPANDPAPQPGIVIDIPRPSGAHADPSRPAAPAPASSLHEQGALMPVRQGVPAPETDSPRSHGGLPASEPVTPSAPAESVSPLDQVLENDLLWLLSALDRAWAEVLHKGGPPHALIEGLAGLVNRALEMAASAAAVRGKSAEDPEELLLRLIPQHRIAAYIPVANGKLDVSPLVKHCRELAATHKPVEPVVADAFACLVHALREALEAMLSLAQSAALAIQLRDTYGVFIEVLERERDRLRELAGVSPGSAAIALPPSDTAAQRFMVLRLRSEQPGAVRP
jgi:hypothetical protein